MKALVCFFAAVLPLALVSHAQNLLTNGGFESGDFTGWTTSGDVQVDATAGASSEGSYAAKFSLPESGPAQDATLTQSVTTEPGALYRLDFDYRVSEPRSLAAYVTVDGGITHKEFRSAPGPYLHFLHVFVASGTSVTVSLNFNVGEGPGTIFADNLTLVATTFSRPGKYAGTLRVLSEYSAGDISAATVVRMAVRIEANGRFIALPRGVVGFAPVAGLIQDSGKITLEGAPEIPATISGKRISFGNESTISKLGATIKRTETWTLQRVAR